jgi:hypothetical protein
MLEVRPFQWRSDRAHAVYDVPAALGTIIKLRALWIKCRDLVAYEPPMELIVYIVVTVAIVIVVIRTTYGWRRSQSGLEERETARESYMILEDLSEQLDHPKSAVADPGRKMRSSDRPGQDVRE